MYPDDYNKTTLMDDSLTKIKNQILRKIKFHKKKEIEIPDFVRKTREEIINQRKKREEESLDNKQDHQKLSK